jgi:hypothetical protein
LAENNAIPENPEVYHDITFQILSHSHLPLPLFPGIVQFSAEEIAEKTYPLPCCKAHCWVHYRRFQERELHPLSSMWPMTLLGLNYYNSDCYSPLDSATNWTEMIFLIRRLSSHQSGIVLRYCIFQLLSAIDALGFSGGELGSVHEAKWSCCVWREWYCWISERSPCSISEWKLSSLGNISDRKRHDLGHFGEGLSILVEPQPAYSECIRIKDHKYHL